MAEEEAGPVRTMPAHWATTGCSAMMLPSSTPPTSAATAPPSEKPTTWMP